MLSVHEGFFLYLFFSSFVPLPSNSPVYSPKIFLNIHFFFLLYFLAFNTVQSRKPCKMCRVISMWRPYSKNLRHTAHQTLQTEAEISTVIIFILCFRSLVWCSTCRNDLNIFFQWYLKTNKRKKSFLSALTQSWLSIFPLHV